MKRSSDKACGLCVMDEEANQSTILAPSEDYCCHSFLLVHKTVYLSVTCLNAHDLKISLYDISSSWI